MKGDLILLGLTGAAILIIPMAVTVGSGLGPQGSAMEPPASVSQSQQGESWSTVSLPESGAAQVVLPSSSQQGEPEPEQGEKKANQKPPVQQAGAYKLPVKTFKIFNRSSGKVDEVDVLDYVRGAIAAEMPASYHLEAMKAQGVAALTYALYHLREQQQDPDPTLKGAYFSADPDKREVYMTEKEAKKFYGENKQYNWSKVCEAADEAVKWVALYDGEPIAAAYHAISTGNTEFAENIWQQSKPYLVSVESGCDILANEYRSTATLTQAQIRERLEGTGVTLLPNADTWFTIEERSDAGYVTQVRVGNQTMTGNQLRNLLGLRSSSFQIERQGKDFLFYVVGYGHGAGMSQNGADYMARQGKGFDEILTHYYSGVVVTPCK